MRTVPVGNLAEADTELALTDSGQPLEPLVVDLDEPVDPQNLALVERKLSDCRTTIIGRSHGPLDSAGTKLAEALDLTLVPFSAQSVMTPTHLIGVADVDVVLKQLLVGAGRNPQATAVLGQVLRVSERLPVADALLVESLAYSMLLSAPAFKRWRSGNPRRPAPQVSDPLRIVRQGSHLSLTLSNPARRNAFGRALRDALIDAFELVAIDSSIKVVELAGDGPAFCSGGDLDEFGTTPDPGTAHLVRLRQNVGLALHRVAERVAVRLHGACIGAGIELAAFAGSVSAADDTYVQLPELAMGLIPGAGGTVSLPRRIGRWRTFYLALLGSPVPVNELAGWGLVDHRA